MRRLVLVFVLLAACGDGAGEPRTTPPVETTAATGTTVPPADTTTTAPAPTTTTIEPDDDVVDVLVTIAGGDVTVTVDGEPLRGRVRVDLGGMVRIELVTDVAEELHVHGYDHLIEADPGETAAVEFVADIPGIFEVERHFAGHLRIFDLHVE